MDPSKILHEPWIDRLVAEPSADKRLSLSMEGVLKLTGSPGVSQWLELAPGHFRNMRERGAVDETVTPEVLEQVASGRWDPQLAQSLILLTGEAPKRMAWALTTPLVEEETLVSAEAFLFLVGVLHPTDYDMDYPSLLPSPGDED